jgi:hypothetical protein
MRNPFRHTASAEGTATRSVGSAPESRRYEGGREPVDERAREPYEGEPRRGVGWRSRNAGAAAVGAVGSGVLMIARLVMTLAALIALLIALAIVLFDVGANGSNTIVKGIHEGANFFAGSFTGMITFSGKPKLELSVDWAIAIAAFLIVGAVIAGAIRSVGVGGVRFEQRHRPAL